MIVVLMLLFLLPLIPDAYADADADAARMGVLCMCVCVCVCLFFVGNYDRGKGERAAQSVRESKGERSGGDPVPHHASEGRARQDQLAPRQGAHPRGKLISPAKPATAI